MSTWRPRFLWFAQQASSTRFYPLGNVSTTILMLEGEWNVQRDHPDGREVHGSRREGSQALLATESSEAREPRTPRRRRVYSGALGRRRPKQQTLDEPKVGSQLGEIFAVGARQADAAQAL